MPDEEVPVRPLVFAPLAWLKLQFLCHAGPTEVGGFGGEVDFLFQRGGDVLHHRRGAMNFPAVEIVFHQRRQMGHDLQVHFDDFADAGPLDFHHDIVPADQPGAMHLGDGSRPQRLLINRLKDFFERAFEFRAENGLHIGKGNLRHAVL